MVTTIKKEQNAYTGIISGIWRKTMPPSTDRIFCFPLYGGIPGHNGFCRVRTYIQNKYAVITGLRLCPASVTNNISQIVNGLKKYNIINEETIIIEHDDAYDFDIVTLTEGRPVWTAQSSREIAKLLECDHNELIKPTMQSEYLRLEIEMLASTYKYPGHDDYRKEEFWKSQLKSIFKSNLESLVKCGKGEREIQSFLKTNLRCFAEYYADPKNEFIIFSEFPIGDDVADFVVFTSRSRMNVIIIEIKGADYNFANQSSYKGVRSKTRDCLTQIGNHKLYIQNHFKDFKLKVHKLRELVENGEQIYNSTMGPKKYLDVAADKEVLVFYSIIGGRMVSDLEESNIRHSIEIDKNRFSIDSWDSWLRKYSI